jgi:MarR family transcriptional regulator for hemolysin
VQELTHELDAPPWRRVDVTLMATAKAMRQAYDRLLAPLELSFHEAVLIAYLLQTGEPTNQTDLARHLGFGRASTGTRIDSLELRGVVVRQPGRGDRRVWMISLTAAGRALAQQVLDVDASLRGELRRGIDAGERRRLAAILLQLQENLARVVGAAATD